MLALISATEIPYVRLAEVPDTVLALDQALVRLSASSLNRGEVLDLRGRPSPPGSVGAVRCGTRPVAGTGSGEGR
jgi:NADPH:quinone reductase-like Zn-dependent oxidoreductase